MPLHEETWNSSLKLSESSITVEVLLSVPSVEQPTEVMSSNSSSLNAFDAEINRDKIGTQACYIHQCTNKGIVMYIACLCPKLVFLCNPCITFQIYICNTPFYVYGLTHVIVDVSSSPALLHKCFLYIIQHFTLVLYKLLCTSVYRINSIMY